MNEIILTAFDEWTENVEPERRRIAIFERIRDIPYVITGIIDPVELLKRNKGTCSPKHFLLGMMYQNLDIPVKYASYPFKWSDLGIDYPETLRALTDELPVIPHVASKAYINGKWVLLDATWDPPLKEVGFPVNESWDGYSNTLNAVNPREEVIHNTVQDRMEYLEWFESQYTEEHYELIDAFCAELNDWLEDVRAHSEKKR